MNTTQYRPLAFVISIFTYQLISVFTRRKICDKVTPRAADTTADHRAELPQRAKMLPKFRFCIHACRRPCSLSYVIRKARQVRGARARAFITCKLSRKPNVKAARGSRPRYDSCTQPYYFGNRMRAQRGQSSKFSANQIIRWL